MSSSRQISSAYHHPFTLVTIRIKYPGTNIIYSYQFLTYSEFAKGLIDWIGNQYDLSNRFKYNLLCFHQNIYAQFINYILPGDISVVDPDGTKTGYVYNMVSLGTPFYVLGNSLHVERHPLDYEITPAISIQIHVREIDTNLVHTKMFHINVTDVPEPPTSLTINGNITVWVPETFLNPGSLGKILAEDPDHDNGAMTFTFYQDQPSEFQIDGDQLMLVNSLDSWERRLFDLPMQVTDNTGLTFRQVIFVRVTEEDRCHEEGYCSRYATCVHNKCQCRTGFDGKLLNFQMQIV